MPAWVMHLKTAKEVNNFLNLSQDEFIFGNVMVDAERHIIDNLSVVIPYDISHFAKLRNIKDMKIKLPDYQRFICEYKEYAKNPVILGYYVHLLTDYFWNNLTFNNYFLSDEKGNVIGIKLNNNTDFITDKNTIRILKQTDFETFSRHIFKDFDIKINEKLIDSILRDCNIIKEIPYNRSDIEKIINYVNSMKSSYEKKDPYEFQYKVFTKDKFYEYFDMSIRFIIGNLKSVL